MPGKAAEIWKRLRLDPGAMTLDSAAISEALSHGKQLETGDALFKRAEGPEEPKKAPAAEAPRPPKAPEGPVEELSLADFKKVDLRTALVLSAEALPKSDKLVKLTVRLHDGERVIVAGIRKYFEPEDLVGKTIVVVANLAPVKLMGVRSQGMVLCASGNDTLAVMLPSRELPAGSPLS
jgi:methionyl-tRNA synthetase